MEDQTACAPRRLARTSNRGIRGRQSCGGVNVVHGGRPDLHPCLPSDRQAWIPKTASRRGPPKFPRHRPLPPPARRRTEQAEEEDPAEAVFLYHEAPDRDRLSREALLPGARRR